MYPADLLRRSSGFFIPCIRKEITSKVNEFQNIRLINQYLQCEKHCTKPGTPVVSQLSIGILPTIIFPVDSGKPPDKSGEIIAGKNQKVPKKGKGEQGYGIRKFKNQQNIENNRTGYHGY
jgi:hypothetical protein